MVLIAAVCAVLLIIVILNLIICIYCIRKHKKRVDVLERQKVDWSNKKKPQLVAVGDALPDSDIDDSARMPL